MEIIDGGIIAEKRKSKLKVLLGRDKKFNNLVLASVVVEGDQRALSYVKLKEKLACELGIEFVKKIVPESASEHEVRVEIDKLNRDPAISGLWVQLPLPKLWNTRLICDQIDPAKDVDCLTASRLGLLFGLDTQLYPATVRAVCTILRERKINLWGKRVVILGSSPWLGKPLALVLSHQGASVSMLWESEKNPADFTVEADVVVSCVGKPGIVTGSMVKSGVVVIDVGVSFMAGKPVGDVLFDEVAEKTSLITPVPGGVGPVTVVSLMENLLLLKDPDIYRDLDSI